MPEEELVALYDQNSFKKITGGRNQGVEDQNAHYRKGISGDWRNYFDESLITYFREVTRDLLEVLGYEE